MDARKKAIEKVLSTMDSKSYEEALEKGDTKSLLAFKMGTFEQQVNNEMYQILKEEGDLKSWVKEYKTADEKIKQIRARIENTKNDLLADKRREIDYKIAGVQKLNLPNKDAIIRQLENEFQKHKQEIEQNMLPEIRELERQIQEIKLNKMVFENLIMDFYKENKELIEKIETEKKIEKIKTSGLLDILGDKN